ncbi:BACON domain-containing protein [Seonamhaeicola algicola]|uniref:BACON domain-containing protein n=1 Tax=Seonamhaeicola algicola TaxID=1719036 RepID=A0A5C7ABZ1_9FLAO|nr:BACON domain-containing carbohydrate-binding protein [Seonamhaeicola algicola]TXE06098.1 BACON domain-containing protein [Seonamhaeicola algicola]
MKTIYKIHVSNVSKLWALLLLMVGLVACSEDETATEAPYFSIEENPTGLTVDINGVTQSYVVRSNQPWEIIAQSEGNWVKAFPNKGDDDGIFKFIIEENNTFDARVMNFAFVVNGKEQPALFRVEQAANVPFINVQNANEGIGVPSAGGNFQINLNANVDWAYQITNGNWISELEVSETFIKLSAEKNKGTERVATLTIQSANHPSLTKNITITQSDGSIVLEEHFDWLTYGSTIFYTTSGEKRMDSWTDEELDRGWTSTPNTNSSNQQVVYARTGFVKLGKTGYGGDLISPKFSILDEETNVKVTFKAVPYQTKKGTQDDNLLKVGVVGPGTASAEAFTISNWPDYDADPECTAIWEDAASTYTFTITGATNQTQLRLLGGDFSLVGVGKGKNRIFLDDIKVEIIP